MSSRWRVLVSAMVRAGADPCNQGQAKSVYYNCYKMTFCTISSLIDVDESGNCRHNQQHPTQHHIHPPQWHFLVHLTVQSALSIMYSLLGNKCNLTNYRHNDRPCSSFFSVFLPALSWRPLQRMDVKTGWQVTQGGQCEYIITAWEHLPFVNCMKCIVANWATLAFVEFTRSSFMWRPLSLKW